MRMADDQWVERALRGMERVWPGQAVVSAELLPAHASPRRYVRATLTGREGSVLVMVLPPADREPEEKGATLVDEVAQEPFVQLASWLGGDAGLPVPGVFGVDEVSRTVMLEDFGEVELLQAWTEATATARPALHEAAVDLLLSWQQRTLACPIHPLVNGRAMDGPLLLWELEHYVEWRLKEDLGVPLAPHESTLLQQAFSRWVEAIERMPTVVIHRDWQSRNLMCRRNGQLGILDFQDAMMGPYVYDVVALLRDSYVDLPAGARARYLERFARGSVEAGRGSDVSTVVRDATLMTLQRKLKDAGRFVYIDRVRGNPGFLRFIDLSMAHVADAMRAFPEEHEVAEVLARHDPAFRAAWVQP